MSTTTWRDRSSLRPRSLGISYSDSSTGLAVDRVSRDSWQHFSKAIVSGPWKYHTTTACVHLGNSVYLAIQEGKSKVVRQACGEFLAAASKFYNLAVWPVRVLAARPLQVRDTGWATELFGDYAPEAAPIRV